MTIELMFDIEEDERCLPISWEKIIREMVISCIGMENCPYECDVEVTVTDDAGMRGINFDARGIDAPTDVLSFPTLSLPHPSFFSAIDEDDPLLFHPDSGELLLGDIVINQDRVDSQSKEYGHSRERELAFLVTHSMLHLFGYDHVNEDERVEMEKRQEEILSRSGYVR